MPLLAACPARFGNAPAQLRRRRQAGDSTIAEQGSPRVYFIVWSTVWPNATLVARHRRVFRRDDGRADGVAGRRVAEASAASDGGCSRAYQPFGNLRRSREPDIECCQGRKLAVSRWFWIRAYIVRLRKMERRPERSPPEKSSVGGQAERSSVHLFGSGGPTRFAPRPPKSLAGSTATRPNAACAPWSSQQNSAVRLGQTAEQLSSG